MQFARHEIFFFFFTRLVQAFWLTKEIKLTMLEWRHVYTEHNNWEPLHLQWLWPGLQETQGGSNPPSSHPSIELSWDRGFRAQLQAPPISSLAFDLSTMWYCVEWRNARWSEPESSISMNVVCSFWLQLVYFLINQHAPFYAYFEVVVFTESTNFSLCCHASAC